jgi:hypothetical protein
MGMVILPSLFEADPLVWLNYQKNYHSDKILCSSQTELNFSMAILPAFVKMQTFVRFKNQHMC